MCYTGKLLQLHFLKKLNNNGSSEMCYITKGYKALHAKFRYRRPHREKVMPQQRDLPLRVNYFKFFENFTLCPKNSSYDCNM